MFPVYSVTYVPGLYRLSRSSALLIFIPALIRGAHELYREIVADRDALGERVAPFESHFNAKERPGTSEDHQRTA